MQAVKNALARDIRERMAEMRERTWLLADGLPDECLQLPIADYLSPPSWDLGHMANFEELWLVQNLDHCAERHAGFNDMYDAFKTPRAERPALRLMDRGQLHAYMDEVRALSLHVLDRIDLGKGRLCKDGFVYDMLILHEAQHQETLLQSFVMRGREQGYLPPAGRTLPASAGRGATWRDVPAGPFPMGRDHVPGSYDNEAPTHMFDVPAFQIATYPVTNGEYLAFIEAGGYTTPQWWSEQGQAWLDETQAMAPLYWAYEGGRWQRTNLRDEQAIEDVADEILCHVSFFEAEAYARWAGARLPTEAEWEKACRHAPDGQTSLNPWGDDLADIDRANIDHLGWGPSEAGAYPDGVSAYGVHQMIGDVWEWCSDGFEAYPGFEAFPYDEYSKVFFGGDYHVLRGGAWAARAGCSTGTFRNWDHPYRRQIFTGIRLARHPAP